MLAFIALGGVVEILIATNNAHKVEEISSALAGLSVKLITPRDLGLSGDVIEDGSTFVQNARIKANAFFGKTKAFILADDSGLKVDALGGEPGIHSARYAGEQGNYSANNNKLLQELRDVPESARGAHFVCTMVLLAPEGQEWVIEGRCDGKIISEFKGKAGFGFDPLFFVPELNKTMAELSMAEKNEISHRGRAIQKLRAILVEILAKN